MTTMVSNSTIDRTVKQLRAADPGQPLWHYRKQARAVMYLLDYDPAHAPAAARLHTELTADFPELSPEILAVVVRRARRAAKQHEAHVVIDGPTGFGRRAVALAYSRALVDAGVLTDPQLLDLLDGMPSGADTAAIEEAVRGTFARARTLGCAITLRGESLLSRSKAEAVDIGRALAATVPANNDVPVIVRADRFGTFDLFRSSASLTRTVAPWAVCILREVDAAAALRVLRRRLPADEKLVGSVRDEVRAALSRLTAFEWRDLGGLSAVHRLADRIGADPRPASDAAMDCLGRITEDVQRSRASQRKHRPALDSAVWDFGFDVYGTEAHLPIAGFESVCVDSRAPGKPDGARGVRNSQRVRTLADGLRRQGLPVVVWTDDAGVWQGFDGTVMVSDPAVYPEQYAETFSPEHHEFALVVDQPLLRAEDVDGFRNGTPGRLLIDAFARTPGRPVACAVLHASYDRAIGRASVHLAPTYGGRSPVFAGHSDRYTRPDPLPVGGVATVTLLERDLSLAVFPTESGSVAS
ncbi:hypothetical protein ACT17_06085 [Mycolicibacterium conceptionense]|uniref:Uncharacterized protein n=1 Tax=Mycolicibacterium conceptionense TaxID=451644 RepID=A0A0J8UFB1_9MYCO|nr:hypothetical protein [Mycolicibacterium conceptionense]KMV19612.1 hypothetical protein ACT17_06085 [Mycolicibacterium conceptionense]